MNTLDPSQLPDTYWRVSAKALIYDSTGRLLVCMDKNHEWEIPGGGWEHAENFAQCIIRELHEELRVGVVEVSEVAFCYTGKSARGLPKLCVAARVIIDDSPLTPTDDDLVEAQFVTREEFLELPFQHGEETIQAYADQIWP